MSKKKKEKFAKVIYRILALILALLMVVGSAYYVIAMILGTM